MRDVYKNICGLMMLGYMAVLLHTRSPPLNMGAYDPNAGQSGGLGAYGNSSLQWPNGSGLRHLSWTVSHSKSKIELRKVYLG